MVTHNRSNGIGDCPAAGNLRRGETGITLSAHGLRGQRLSRSENGLVQTKMTFGSGKKRWSFGEPAIGETQSMNDALNIRRPGRSEHISSRRCFCKEMLAQNKIRKIPR